MADKRPARDEGLPRTAKAAKLQRLGDDLVAEGRGGVNVITVGGKSCTHEVCWPPGEAGSSAPPPKHAGPPARQYPFPLDPFQTTAIDALEAGHNVFVAAHTSAGKTVVAEYAFAMGLRDSRRVVYTSPLKALSNQKFRELAATFGDVGLVTGDVTLNPTASCLVMTTEVLRSMLLRGSELVSEVGLVVYDEVHYLRDAERGVVWEEAILLAPAGARMAFLSATVPNAPEFASWAAAAHRSPVHVVYTDYRPTPLQHYLFPAGAGGLFLVVDEGGVFRDDSFQAAVSALGEPGGGARTHGGAAGAAGGRGGDRTSGKAPPSDVSRLVAAAMARGLDPLIVFSFSKRECEAHAAALGALELNNSDEAALVEGVYRNALDLLSEEDQRLPQLGALLPLLRRGIGVHHSGLLPLAKELVEVLFGEGLLKVLFATETFSTGLNMPARSVAFTRARKWDGGAFRWLRSGEYIQMSGRAGRRGLDDKGVVILMFDTQVEPAVIRDMVQGAPDPLTSAFRLRHSQLLALAATEGASAEAMLQSSFLQWQLRSRAPALEARAEALAAARDEIKVEQEEEVSRVLELLTARLRLQEALRAALTDPAAALPFLQPGRLVRVDSGPPDPERPLPQLGPLPPGLDASNSQQLPATAVQPGGDAAPEQQQQLAGGDLPPAPLGNGASVLAALDGSVWGMVVSFQRAGKQRSTGARYAASADSDDDNEAGALPGAGGSSSASGPQYVLDVLVGVDPATLPRGSSQTRGGLLPRLLPPHAPGAAAVVLTVPLEHLAALSSARLRAVADLRAPAARAAGLAAVAEVCGRFAARSTSSSGSGGSAGPPLLDPVADMKLSAKEAGRLASRLEAAEERLASGPCWQDPRLRQLLAALQAKAALGDAARAARREAKAARGLVLGEELRSRSRLLRRLGYLDGEGLVTSKGRVASELASAADELVLAELLLGGAASALAPHQLVALMSTFVWQERSDGSQKLPEELAGPLSALRKAARAVGAASADAKLCSDVDAFVESFRPEAMEAAAAWTRGSRFADALALAPGAFEGSLVRCLRRCEELMRQVVVALRGVGDVELAGRFEDAAARIKRGVVFAPSLYL